MATHENDLEGAGLTLPDPLTMNDGTRVATARQWRERRGEIVDFFTREVYGRSPGRPEAMTFQVVDDTKDALDGLATRRQVAVSFAGQPDGPRMDLLLYIPQGVTGSVPAFLGLNFFGNQAIHADPGIRLPASWRGNPDGTHSDLSGGRDDRPSDGDRGAAAGRWPVETILRRGYALATAARGDINPDHAGGFDRSVRALYPELQTGGDNFSAVAAWAWGLSRALDYLETDPDVDAARVAVMGHSRLGKAALWAGATDERFAMAISNESGAGGAKLFRRGLGESIERLNAVFPHWFCANFRKYDGRDTSLPFDQHMLLSLIAPRPLYVASAQQDAWADPEGEFLAAKAAEPVYRLLGAGGLPADRWPAVDRPSQGTIAYHVRSGAHDVTAYDWEQFLNFADARLRPA
jgi:hypothetical protein